jgi:PAS domain S-box-containing protein
MSIGGEPVQVLHVDAEPRFPDKVAEYLESVDDRLTVAAATDASDGLEQLAETDFDCVISDFDMQGQNGIQFLETVRAEHPDLPFILYTGSGSEEIASDAISAGATDYLQKDRDSERYELLANRVLNAVEQYRTARRAAELDRIRTLTSDINKALVHTESRPAAETRVCEIISDADPYLFAWIGELDPDTDRIEPRASAGIDDDYLDGLTVTADDTPTGQGPGGTAIRERRVAVSQHVADDPEFEPWRDEALDRGYRAVAAVPLEYHDTLYGELVVYAERPDAFDETERELLAELGDDIGHAIHSFTVQESLRSERDRRQALFANAPGPVVASELRNDGDRIEITAVNDAFEEVFGYDAGEIVGTDPADVIVPDEKMDRHREFRERATAGETITTEVERLTTDGPRTFLLHIIPFIAGDSRIGGMYAWYTDISDRRAREQMVEQLHRTTDGLMEATTPDEVAGITTDAVRDILGMPANGVHLYDESAGGLVPVAWTSETEEIVGEPPTFAPGEGIAGTAYAKGEPQFHDDISTVPERFNSATDVRSQIVYPLADYGVLVIGSPEAGAFDNTDISLVKTLADHATAALERVDREEERTRRQQLFESILETSIDGILVVDENREYVTWNQQFIDMWGVPEGVVGDEREERGLESVRDQLERPQKFMDKVEYLYEHPHEESRDEIQLVDGRVFDRYSAPVETDDGTYFGRVWFFRDITDRKEREQALEEKNERLDQFASTLRHELRNPLNILDGYLDVARETGSSEAFQSCQTAVDQMQRLLEQTLIVLKRGDTVLDREPVELGAVCEACWGGIPEPEARLEIDTAQEVVADEDRLKQLLGNLFRNAVEHGGPAVTVQVADLETGFYVEDDGPGIPEDVREAVFDEGYSTSEAGTGLGLAVVAAVAAAHRWDVRITDGPMGGARFEITGVDRP